MPQRPEGSKEHEEEEEKKRRGLSQGSKRRRVEGCRRPANAHSFLPATKIPLPWLPVDLSTRHRKLLSGCFSSTPHTFPYMLIYLRHTVSWEEIYCIMGGDILYQRRMKALAVKDESFSSEG